MILNEEQRNVIESKDQFLFLLASAGSGKTRVIVEKIKKLVSDGVTPESILAITFTRKSAHEMKERIRNEWVNVHTFHQFCYIHLKEVYSAQTRILNETDKTYSKEELLLFSVYKNSLYRKTKPKNYDAYQRYLKEKQLKDFDDLLLDFLYLCKKHFYQLKYQYIFVDEFQDTNLLQYEILKKLITQTTYVLAVGDPDQSIYQFRGASSDIIDLYIKEFKASKMMLSINYRSDQQILKHANYLISLNDRRHPKTLISSRDEQGITKCLIFETETEEALFLIDLIKETASKDISILYREHQRSYELKYQLNVHEIPFMTLDDDHQEQLKLMTIHQAKGLEFETVIIIGLEQGILPKLKNLTKKEEDEERRLLFVAMTRAKKNLYLTYTKMNSQHIYQKPSKFISETKIKRKTNKVK